MSSEGVIYVLCTFKCNHLSRPTALPPSSLVSPLDFWNHKYSQKVNNAKIVWTLNELRNVEQSQIMRSDISEDTCKVIFAIILPLNIDINTIGWLAVQVLAIFSVDHNWTQSVRNQSALYYLVATYSGCHLCGYQ